jgi:hypothetical protein
MQKLWQDIKDILTAPFVGSLDIVHLFLLIGLILVFLSAWAMILRHVALAAQEVV